MYNDTGSRDQEKFAFKRVFFVSEKFSGSWNSLNDAQFVRKETFLTSENAKYIEFLYFASAHCSDCILSASTIAYHHKIALHRLNHRFNVNTSLPLREQFPGR